MSNATPADSDSFLFQNSIDVAQKCLRRQGWNIQQALELFWENPEEFIPQVAPCDVGQLEQMFSKYKGTSSCKLTFSSFLTYCVCPHA
jgi:hypothetical protein